MTMMKRVPMVGVVLAVALATGSSQAQEAAKKEGKTFTESQAVLQSWNDVGRKLIAMAEDFPEDKYDFKPNPSQRNLPSSCCMRRARITTSRILPRARSRRRMRNRSATSTRRRRMLWGFVKKSIADGAAAIQAKGEKGMGERLTGPFSHDKVRVADFAYGFIEHMGEHYHSWRSITGWPGWCRRSRVRRSSLRL